jgi:hypothetical protein
MGLVTVIGLCGASVLAEGSQAGEEGHTGVLFSFGGLPR